MSYRIFLLLGSASLSILSPSFAFAGAVRTVPPVVITASRSPLPLSQVANSMTVIAAEDIARENKSTVTELLRAVPGLAVANNGGTGQTTRMFMRGTNSNHVLVLMDGVPLNDPSDPGDAFDFSNLTTDNIERIEILRGVQSTLYGSQAIGGVINIISKQGRGVPRAQAMAEYGRYNSSKVGIGASGEVGRTSFSLQTSNQHTNGISSFDRKFGGFEKDGSNAYVFTGALKQQLNDRLAATLNLRYSRNRTQFDSPGSQIPRHFDDVAPDNDSRQFNGRAAAELSLLEGKWTQELGLGYLNLNRSQVTEYYDALFNVFFGRQQYHGWRTTMDWVHRVNLIPGHALTFGAEQSTDHFKSLSVAEKDAGNVGVFIDDQYSVTEQFFINAGVRTDMHQTFGRQFTWKIAPGYTIAATGTRLKTTYGTGFKAPSLAQLFDASYGNANLKPEKSRSFDVGFEQPFRDGKVTVGATVFKNFITNLISFDASPPYASVNIGKARTQGVETSLRFEPSADWTVAAAYSYTQADDRRSDKQLSRRPKHQVNASATYQYSMEGDVSMALRYVGKTSDIDFDTPFGRVYVRPFTTVDFATNYKVSNHITLYSRAENLCNKHYEEVYGYGQPGLALYGGIKGDF